MFTYEIFAHRHTQPIYDISGKAYDFVYSPTGTMTLTIYTERGSFSKLLKQNYPYWYQTESSILESKYFQDTSKNSWFSDLQNHSYALLTTADILSYFFNEQDKVDLLILLSKYDDLNIMNFFENLKLPQDQNLIDLILFNLEKF